MAVLIDGRTMICFLVLCFGLLAGAGEVSARQQTQQRSCMVEWLVNIGIPESSAVFYVNKRSFYRTQNLSVFGLLNVRSEDVFVHIGISQERHRLILLACAENSRSCAPAPCFNDGSCNFVPDESRFRCTCKAGWTGERCDEGMGGKTTKGEMRTMLRQHEEREEWLERVLNITHAKTAEMEERYLTKLRDQEAEMNTLRSKMASMVAKNDKRKHKLKTARERANNATRDKIKCSHELHYAEVDKRTLRRQVSTCHSKLGFRFPAQGCGMRMDRRDGLATRGILQQGEELMSPDNELRLTVRPNGTVQAYDRNGGVWWSPPPSRAYHCLPNNGPYRLVILPSGEVQSRDRDDCVVWTTGIALPGQERDVCLLLENSRRIALYAPCGKLLWYNGTEANSTV